MPQDYKDFDRLDFASNYRSGNPIIRFLLNRFYRKLESLIRSRLGSLTAVLEVGSGEGYSTSFIGRLLREHNVMFFSSDLITELISRNKKRTGETNLFVQDIMKLAVGAKKVDLVIALEVLEHLSDPGMAVSELARVTKRWALVSVPFEPWWRLGNIFRGAYLRDLGNTPDHVNHWGKGGFARLLRSDFSRVKVSVSFPWLVALCEHPLARN
jgi:ubiquinone/menaquinone biosynthesis C-methylase UbiE